MCFFIDISISFGIIFIGIQDFQNTQLVRFRDWFGFGVDFRCVRDSKYSNNYWNIDHKYPFSILFCIFGKKLIFGPKVDFRPPGGGIFRAGRGVGGSKTRVSLNTVWIGTNFPLRKWDPKSRFLTPREDSKNCLVLGLRDPFFRLFLSFFEFFWVFCIFSYFLWFFGIFYDFFCILCFYFC